MSKREKCPSCKYTLTDNEIKDRKCWNCGTYLKDKNKSHEFLHNHLNMAVKYDLDDNHVIVDKEDCNQAKNICEIYFKNLNKQSTLD
jgi:hypothetical protein